MRLPVFRGGCFGATGVFTAFGRSKQLFFLPRRTEDDPATERSVASLLETVNKIKWRPAESLDGPEEKVRPGADVCARVAVTHVLVLDTQLPCAPPPLGLLSSGEVSAGEAGIAGKRNV